MVRRLLLFLLLFIGIPAYQAEAVSLESESAFTTVQDSSDAEGIDQQGERDELPGVEEIEHENEEEFAEEEGQAGVSDFVLFIGRFHPIIVHFPIGFLFFAFLLEFVSMFRRYDYLNPAVPFTLLMGVLGGIAAGFTGYMLSQGGGYGEELIFFHKWLGMSVVLFSLLALVIRLNWYDHPVLKKVFRSILVIMTVTVLVTGHYGGSLTHGADYLFRYMPESLRVMTGVELVEEEQIELIEDLDTARIYHDIINPILRARCASCHNPDRREGELLMTSLDEIRDGGENGAVIVTGHAGESELYKRLILPERDDDRMPPRGRIQLTNDQIKLIAWWIDAGVPSTSTISEMEISDEISDILDEMTVAGQSFFARTEVPQANEDSLDLLRQQGFQVSAVADGLHFLNVRLANSRDTISHEEIELLLPYSEQITWLDFSRIRLKDTDSDLSLLSQFKHLTRLDLSNTNITDHSIEFISSLEHLEYLNMYRTGISDEGLQHIEHLSTLESVYLWQTGVSRDGVENLQEKLPLAYIDNGHNNENGDGAADAESDAADAD